MQIAIFCYSKNGANIAKRIFDNFGGKIFIIERLVNYLDNELDENSKICLEAIDSLTYEREFENNDALIFVSSCGISVRKIAPLIKDKQTDPAVICIDELGKFVIPILSGHIGGANKLALKLGKALNSLPIITTATDINNKFSVDTWASENKFIIDDIKLIKAVSATILEKSIPFKSDFEIAGNLPNGLIEYEKSDNKDIGIALTYKKNEPFDKTLRLIPKLIHIGIGCRRGVSKEEISKAVRVSLDLCNIDERAIKCIASIDIKKDESGLLNYCNDNNIELNFYSADELKKVYGNFSSSEFVKKTVGVDNVCERAALMGADKLIIQKTVVGRVTIAIAKENLEVHFG